MAYVPTTLQSGSRLGRFELRRQIGRGGQSWVWLAFDPRLEREVAVKVWRPTGDIEASQVALWLQEARNVSRLNHPNIVQVFEADSEAGQAYLVFEYVDGQTLTDLIRERGASPPAQAVPLMIDVLDALAAAHEAGIIHRDLKPSNIIVDRAGRARVMDFGIAARAQAEPRPMADADGDAGAGASADGSAQMGWGTPGYMSPEAAMGARPQVAMDIFSATLVLAELLCGHRLVTESDPWRAIQRVALYDIDLPADLPAAVDDRLRAILRRGLARDPEQRYPTMTALREALRLWMRPMSMPLPAGEDTGHGTLEFLLRRMRHKSDFPAMSGTIARIQSISSSDRESVATLTNEILKDVALTHKLLRLVNTPMYARGGPISTVSRAVTLVGFHGVRNMALSLVLLEHMQDRAHASVLKQEFLRSLMAGSIAYEMCPVRSEEPEEAFLGAMFQNLGRLLTEYYFADEARAVRALCAGREPLTERHAATLVLGIDFEQLGVGIGQAWNLPDLILRCMHKPEGPPPAHAPRDRESRLRWVALAANEMADVLLERDPKGVVPLVVKVGQRFGKVLGGEAPAMMEAVQRARERLADLALAMDFRVPADSPAQRLLVRPTGAAAGGADSHGLLNALDLAPTQPASALSPLDAVTVPAVRRRSAEMLAAGIQDITQAMTDDFRLADVLRMILETMFRAMDFRYVVFCMREGRQPILTGRFGLGEGVDPVVRAFKVTLAPPAATQPGGATVPPPVQDLLGMICGRGADTLIANAADPKVASRLPPWYAKSVAAPAFLLLPLVLKGTPMGLIYADKAEGSALVIGEEELGQLRTLRNQAIMAFKQAG